MCLGDSVLCVIIHHARQSCSKNSDLLAIGNCYAISCHRHSIVISISCEKQGTSSSRCTIYYPYRVGWLIKPSNIGQSDEAPEQPKADAPKQRYSKTAIVNAVIAQAELNEVDLEEIINDLIEVLADRQTAAA